MQVMRFRSLEAFRGIAAVSVILFHSMFTTESFSYFRLNSHLFVDFFFILSGFIISYAYMQKLSGEQVDAKTFFLKRIFRLYPMHLFLLSIWVVYIFTKHWAYTQHIGGQDPFEANTFTSFVQHLFLVQTWGTGNIMAWNVPSWSVSVEIFAYGLFFLYVIFFKKLSDLAKGGIALLLIVLFEILLHLYPEQSKDFGFLLNGISAFFMGVILFLLYSKTTSRTLDKWFASFMEISLIVSIFLILNRPLTASYDVLTVQFLFAVTIYFFAIQEKGIISKTLHHKALQYLGLLSYSIYLIHAIVVEIAGHIFEYILKISTTFQGSHKILILPYADVINLFLIAFVVFLASFTYKYIEQPARSNLTSLTYLTKKKRDN